MATKRKRGATWHYTVKRAKLLPRPVYLTFDEESDGDAYVARLEALLDAGIVPPDLEDGRHQTGRTLRDLIEDFRQHVAHKEDDEHKLQAVLGPQGGRLLAGLDYPWAEAWVRTMKREKRLAPGTIRKYVGALARVLDHGMRKGWVLVNPLRMLPRGYSRYTEHDAPAGEAREDRSIDRRLLPGEEERILADLRPGADRTLFLLALESAMRLSEMFTLRTDQVDITRRIVFLDRTKNGDSREVPLTTRAAGVLCEHLAEHPGGDMLLPWFDPAAPVVAERKRVAAMLSRRWARRFARLGCEGLTFHCLRHEAICRLYERTDLRAEEIRHIVGHRSEAAHQRYRHFRSANFVDRLW